MKTTDNNQNFTPGCHWKDGKLYHFTKTSITVTRPWGKNAGCWTYSKKNGWQNVSFQPLPARIDGYFSILDVIDPRIIICSEPRFIYGEEGKILTSLPDFFKQCQDVDDFKRTYNSYDFSELLKKFDNAYFFSTLCLIKDYLTAKKFLDCIPKKVRETVALFGCEYHFPLIQFANRTQKAEGLRFMQNYPYLAFMLTFNYKQLGYAKNNRYRNVQNLIKKKPLEILAKFGLPAEKWVLKFFSKIPPVSLNHRCIPRLIRDLNNKDNRKLFMHWTITENSLGEDAVHVFWIFYYANNYPLKFILSIIKEFQTTTSTDFFFHIYQLIHDYFDLAKALGETIKVKNLTTLRKLKREHDRYVRIIHRKKIEQFQKGLLPVFDFPSPPVPETNRIRYIKDSVSLYKEAIIMQHCVDSYEDVIRSGEYAVYHLCDEESGFTVGLYRDVQGRRWTIDAVLGFRNHPATERTKQAVKDWLAEGENEIEEDRYHWPN